MQSIEQIRQSVNKIIVLGNHPFIIQSVLDFDYLSNHKEPSVVGIVGNNTGFAKYFWGKREVLIRVFKDINLAQNALSTNHKSQNTNLWFLNLLSGRRALSSGKEMLATFPSLVGGVFFAEGVPEKHNLELYHAKKEVMLIGPASVGLLVPGALKLGPIGGVTPVQIDEANITTQGKVAVMSASGGMTNELINAVTKAGHHLSFAFSFGGDRFPILGFSEAVRLAETDPQTETVVLYAELGGEEEYQLVDLKKGRKLKKKYIIHIAGTVADLFAESPQFGHAKAKASSVREKARSKRAALKSAGFLVSESYNELLQFINQIKK
jgi:succinyl-CoA synthetase alpha subunit